MLKLFHAEHGSRANPGFGSQTGPPRFFRDRCPGLHKAWSRGRHLRDPDPGQVGRRIGRFGREGGSFRAIGPDGHFP